MPGILPMKVIKVGTTAQTRIAQACDRCRSKKIRCDGFRPTCTQCSNVGFECKTSDKLSRRAFPRGYTESLEERVRALECETRDLKDLLDERDEKIEMLSKMRSHSPQCSALSRRPSSSASQRPERGVLEEGSDAERDIKFKLQQSPYLVHGDNTDLYFIGNSSSRAFMLAFKRKLQESGKTSSDFNVDAFCGPSHALSSTPSYPADHNALWVAPSRLHSDQMVNIFFQEWAPLFPVIHRPTFLTLYEQYVANSANVQDKRSLAQLNLVFGIAALSNDSQIKHSAESCERQWSAALDQFVKETSLATLQCLILAQIYCIQRGDHQRVLQYKGIAVAMSQRLGLHLSQKRFALGVLTVETRKKVFWSLYAVDCFSAALLGLPKMLHEDHIFCEYPVDADDEYVTEKGFQPTLPGEFTKLSSALALFRGCRILGKVLNQNYPAASSHELSLNTISSLDEELETWSKELPSHLKLEFVQDKPATNTISSRSPLLSLTYNFIRTLIHRPVVSANIGDRSSTSVVALAGAHKRIIQVIQLLDERSLAFTHCLNKNEVLTTSGIGLLFQSLDLDRAGKMMQDSQRLLCSVIKMLEKRTAPGAAEFKQLGCSMLSLPAMSPPPPPNQQSVTSPKRSQSSASTTTSGRQSSHGHIAHLAANYSRFSMTPSGFRQEGLKESRKSTSAIAPAPPSDKATRNTGDKSLRPLAPSLPSQLSRASSSLNPGATETSRLSSVRSKERQSSTVQEPRTNLDYFSFSEGPMPSIRGHRDPANKDNSNWETALSNFANDTQDNSSAESIYEWPPIDTMLSPTSLEQPQPPNNTTTKSGCDGTWSPELWTFEDSQSHIPQSVLSFSDESLTSGEEFSSIEYGSSRSDSGFRTISIPQLDPDQGFSPGAFGDVEAFNRTVGT